MDIKAEEVRIASFNPSGVPTGGSLDYRESNGEKDWVSNQTSIIARDGGTIESKNFTNSGAIIGSESAENKLTVKTDKITVEQLEDKDTNKTVGGGVNISGGGVPGVSVVAGSEDKRQNTNATAINTDFEIAGEKKTAEELGLKTDKSKAQEITKDEKDLLDADLHTDLLNKSERDNIALAGQKLGDLADAITDTNSGGIFNTYKENRQGNLLNKYASENIAILNIIADESTSDEEKIILSNKFMHGFFKELGYTGTMPEIMIGEESAAVDIDKETAKNMKKRLFLYQKRI